MFPARWALSVAALAADFIEPPLLSRNFSALRVIATTMLVANSFTKEAGSLNKSLTPFEYYDYFEEITVIGFIFNSNYFVLHLNASISDVIYFDINRTILSNMGGASNRSVLEGISTQPQSAA